MAQQATATMEIVNWEEAPYSEIEGGPNLVSASVRQGYKGELEGEGTLTYLMVYREDGNVPTVAFERFVGRIGDRSGSVVFQHEGAYADNVASSTFTIVPGTGTGDLRGLRGQGSFRWEHEQPGTCVVEYSIEGQ